MTTTESSAPAQPATRELRGLQLYKDHAGDIRFEDGVWLVPSQHEVATTYEVTLGRHESCECSDFEFHGSSEACKHVYAATIAKAKTAPCSGCGQRYRHRHLTEVGPDHLTLFEGDLVCPECAADHGLL